MSSRGEAFASILRGELDRIGRSSVSVDLDDDFSVTLRDRDGQWRGAAPVAYGALAVCLVADGAGSGFWSVFPRAPASG